MGAHPSHLFQHREDVAAPIMKKKDDRPLYSSYRSVRARPLEVVVLRGLPRVDHGALEVLLDGLVQLLLPHDSLKLHVPKAPGSLVSVVSVAMSCFLPRKAFQMPCSPAARADRARCWRPSSASASGRAPSACHDAKRLSSTPPQQRQGLRPLRRIATCTHHGALQAPRPFSI